MIFINNSVSLDEHTCEEFVWPEGVLKWLLAIFICDAGTFTTISIYQYRKLTTKLSRDDTLKITEVTGIKEKAINAF